MCQLLVCKHSSRIPLGALLAVVVLHLAATAEDCSSSACPSAELEDHADPSLLQQGRRIRSTALSPTGVPACSSKSDCVKKYAAGAGVKGAAARGKSWKRGVPLGSPSTEATEPCSLADPSSKGCPLRGMPRDVTTLVQPGGLTSCIDPLSPFEFQVIPGDSDKLLFFFQGGGVCFDRFTTVIQPACDQIASPDPLEGMLNRSDPNNPYSKYTVVDVMYCSGDAHVGNVTNVYEDADGNNVTVTQSGYHNALSALEWALVQMPKLRSLVISGYSAGALGTQLWSRVLFDRFADRVHGGMGAIADSYLGFLPPQIPAGILFLSFGTCTVPLLTPELEQKCLVGQATVEGAYLDAMKAYPKSAFSLINSKEDKTQIYFYNLFAQSIGVPTIDGPQYTQLMNQYLQVFIPQPNLVTYIVEGSMHTFVNQPEFYTADTRGPEGALLPPPEACSSRGPNSDVLCPLSGVSCAGATCCPSTPGLVDEQTFPCPSAPAHFRKCEHQVKVQDCVLPPPALVEWSGRFPLLPCEAVASECSGELLMQTDWNGTTYCDAAQAGQVFGRQSKKCECPWSKYMKKKWRNHRWR